MTTSCPFAQDDSPAPGHVRHDMTSAIGLLVCAQTTLRAGDEEERELADMLDDDVESLRAKLALFKTKHNIP